MRSTDRRRGSIRTREQKKLTEKRLRRAAAFLENDTIPERLEEDGEQDIDLHDEESWGGENTPQDAVDSESPDFQLITSIRPLWILYKGRLIWASGKLGRDLREREFFRRRIQAFLDFLADEFPDKSDEDRLLAMQGLFMEEEEEKEKEKNNKEGKGTAWLSRLDKDGIVYGENRIISLKMLRTKQGGGGRGNDSCPDPLLLLWLERELKEHPGESPLKWRNCKNWIIGINDFLSKVNDKLNNFVISGGIGLKDVNFHYEESTIQRKHLSEWRKWWEARK